MNSPHIDDQAAGLATLPVADSERIAAYSHAASCPRCKQALDEAERLLTLLAADSLPGPSRAALDRAWAAVSAEMDENERPLPYTVRGNAQTVFALVAAVLLSALFASFDAEGGALAWKIGIECLFIELGAGAVPLALFRRNAPERRGPALYGAIGACGALAGQAYLHFRCPVAHASVHLLAFHFGGVVIAAALASAVGSLRERSAA